MRTEPTHEDEEDPLDEDGLGEQEEDDEESPDCPE